MKREPRSANRVDNEELRELKLVTATYKGKNKELVHKILQGKYEERFQLPV